MISFVPVIGGFFIWLLNGRKTNLKNEIQAGTWVSWGVGYIAVVIFLVLGFAFVVYVQGAA